MQLCWYSSTTIPRGLLVGLGNASLEPRQVGDEPGFESEVLDLNLPVLLGSALRFGESRAAARVLPGAHRAGIPTL
jgi:hypothetical protein